ncbi:MAG: hypothetical protein VX777_09245 [Chlamydiota bacterium]|nr:hypothetical protein [Chlamydiota bacterium]
MLIDAINKIKSFIKCTVEAPEFYSKIYSYVVRQRKIEQKLDSDNLKRVCSEEYDGLSVRIDSNSLQDSSAVRNNQRTRRIANLVINENGSVDKNTLEILIERLKEHLYFLGPDRQHDTRRQEHILKVLEMLAESKELNHALQAIQKPYMHPVADEIIRETLDLPPKHAVNNAHARRAALCALMCYLRQALGSCFATAPAIIVHDEQPLQFLSDISQLFSSGQLKRVFGGVEYSVPFSASTGAGDLKRPFIMSTDPVKGSLEICSQPGLITALENEGVISPEAPIKNKILQLQALIKEFLIEKRPIGTQFIITAEEIFKGILLNHFSLTADDILEYDSRIPGMSHGNLMMQAPKAGKRPTGKGLLVPQYKEAYKSVKESYKKFSDNALLRCWEYTLASFAETKGEFSKWNLYSSLGLRHDDVGGIGSCLFEILKKKLEEFNSKVEDYQFQYEQMFAQVKILERRLKNASSEDEARWLKIDYRAKATELGILQGLRDDAHANAQRIANFFDVLIDFYINLFPEFFQEVYDPELVDVEVGPYDDTPAGFRLLCKHGRSNTSQWTVINSPQEFIEALVSFFIAAERQMDGKERFKGLDKALTEITTEIVSHIRTEEFLESTFHRMAAAHNQPKVENPLQNLEKVTKKPWIYTSGGNLNTLVSVYFHREHQPKSISRWVENPQELLVFLVDTLKEVPYTLADEYKENPKKSMLMHSPTHAFLLKPGDSPFLEAWDNDEYSYTFIRDKMIFPMERFIDDQILNADAMQYIVKRLLPKVPIDYQHYFHQSFGGLKGSMSPQVFRDYLVYGMESNPGLQYRRNPVLSSHVIDSELYACLPIIPVYKVKERMEIVLKQLPDLSEKSINEATQCFDEFTAKVLGETVMGAKQFQEVCKAFICLVTEQTSFPHDYHALVKQICEKEKFSMPRPIVFADTNWVKDDFAFVVNPGTGAVEFWRVDPLGVDGVPMVSWKHWLDGSRKKPDWGVFTQPREYVGK